MGYHNHLKELRTYVHHLVKTRNKIFAKLQGMKEYFWESGIYKYYKNEDYSTFMKFTNHIKQRPEISSAQLW